MSHFILWLLIILTLDIFVATSIDSNNAKETFRKSSQLNVKDTSDIQNILPLTKDASTHFLLQMHDAIQGLHSHYLKMMRIETFTMKNYDNNSNISSKCIEGLMEFSRGLNEKRIWALMMVDSCGKTPSGILEGTFYSTGDINQCVDVNIPEKFQGQYCEVGFTQKFNFQYLWDSGDPSEILDLSYALETNQSKVWDYDEKFPNGFYPVTTSLCLPSKCSVKDIQFIVSKATSAHEEDLKIKVSDCYIKSQWNYTKGQKIGMTFIIVIIAVEVIATAVDIHLNYSEDKNTKSSKQNFLWKMLQCLSLRINLIELLKKDSNPNSVKIFHGLKVFTLLKTLALHHRLNALLVYARMRQHHKFSSTSIICSFLIILVNVDTLSFISGFLVLYINSKMSSLNVKNYFLPRYLRVRLPVVFMYGAHFFFLNMVDPITLKFFKMYTKQNIHWWKNALCINNFFPISKQFLSWTWQISCDMQLYTGAFFILLIYKRNPVKAMNIVRIIIAVSLSFLAFQIYFHGWRPIPVSSFMKPSTRHYHSENRHFATVQHIAPYCVGILTCDIIVTRKYSRISKSKTFFRTQPIKALIFCSNIGILSKIHIMAVKLSGWFLSIVISYVVWIMPYIWNRNHQSTTFVSVIFGSLDRFLWSLVLAWITFTYCNGEKGILVSVLSWDGFTPLSRLSFMGFISNLLYIRFTEFSISRSNFIYSYSSLMASILIFAIAAFIISFVLYMVCEAPLNCLLKLIFKRDGKKKQ